MSKLLKLRQERRAALGSAKALADLATSEGRDFTSSERASVEANLAAAKRLSTEIAELERDPAEVKAAEVETEKALRQAVLELGAGGDPARPRGKAGAWSAALAKSYPGFMGRKEFLPTTGTVGVPNPINSIGTLADVGRAETLLQFIPREPAGQTDSVSYLRETERTHNAAPVEVGELKPTSVYTLERIDTRIKTIAHLSEPISRNWLSDAPLLGQYLDGVLREGLDLEVEDQVISGDGLGENFLGVLNTPLVQAQPFDTNMVITARRAITLIEDLPATPTGYVFNPHNWEEIELTQNLNDDFLLKNAGQGLPVDRANRRLWGLPVALSVRMTQGQAILGDWKAGSRIWPRDEARVDWSESFQSTGFETGYDLTSASGFERNLVKFRAELRTLFAVLIGRQFVVIDLEAGS